MKKLTPALAILGILSGCAHTITLTDFQSGEVLRGQYNQLTKGVTITMPDGEVLAGKYIAIHSGGIGASFGNAFAFSGTQTAYGLGTGFAMNPGGGNAYALLKSEKSNLMMEMVGIFDEWTGHGFGEAETNDGRKYKAEF